MNLTTLIRKLESQLKNAEKLARQYDAQADALRNKLSTVAGALGKAVFGKSPAAKGRKKRGMSASGRARIRAAKKKRWAAFHAKHGKKAIVKKGKRKMSAAGRARIIAAQKARWAKFRQK